MRVTLASPTRRLLSLATLLVLLSCVASKAQSPPLPLLPNGVAYDAAGNLYFSDTNRHQVYESSLSGVLTVVAGSGIQGFAGDGGPATSAQLNSPQGIAIGPDGTLYIADTGNQRIRTVIAGQIATFAGNGTAGFAGDGGAALSASLHTPTALALDATGALLVCDTANHRVRRISAGQIATIVGSGVQGFAGDGAAAMAAQLDTPSGIAVGPNGRLYIADTHNSRIRVIAANGTIATFAGNGIRSYFGDGGQATAAGLSLPRGLAITTAGTLLFADSDNQRVRMVDAQGTITTIAGTGVQGSSVDGSPAATAALDTPRTVSVSTFGSPVLADAGNHQIRESLDNTTLYLPAGLASGRTSTISLTANPDANTNQAIASVSVLGSAGTPQGSVSLFDGTALVGQMSLTTGTANFPLGSLANGSHALSATYVGDGVNPAATSNIVTINIGALTVTATANSQTMEYGQPIPVLTGTLSGVLPQDIGNVNVIFSTSATSLSVPGSYAITAVLTGSASSNYTLSLSPSSGSLLISQADSLTVEQPLTQSSYAGLPLVLTASVASTTQGTPTGTVSFSDGSSLIATAALSGGIASATYLSPPAGTVSITASYAGDKNFKPSSSQRMTATVSAMPDFTVSASTTTQTIAAGGVASYAMTVAAQPAPFTGVVYLSASNLPAGATATFSPPQSVPGMGSAAVTMSVQTSTAQGERVDHTGALLTTCLLLPVSMFLFRRRTLRRIAPASAVVLILLNTLGCGARSITTDALSKQVYTFQVTGTSTNLAGSVIAHSLTVTLIVQ